MNREDYERDLEKRQKEHLAKVEAHRKASNELFIPCVHNECAECVGTFVKLDGTSCIHYISCHCPKCSPGGFTVSYSEEPLTFSQA